MSALAETLTISPCDADPGFAPDVASKRPGRSSAGNQRLPGGHSGPSSPFWLKTTRTCWYRVLPPQAANHTLSQMCVCVNDGFLVVGDYTEVREKKKKKVEFLRWQTTLVFSAANKPQHRSFYTTKSSPKVSQASFLLDAKISSRLLHYRNCRLRNTADRRL